MSVSARRKNRENNREFFDRDPAIAEFCKICEFLSECGESTGNSVDI
jgi:hypothetical protein